MADKLYERPDIYDLIESEQRTESIRNDWELFLKGMEIHTFLDVSIGTGSMTLPLQELGVQLYGSDLSEQMLSKCEQKARDKGRPIELKISDFRDLTCWQGRLFDCVASTGNALAYVQNQEVLTVLEQMDRLVKRGGYLCFDSRNWEKIQREKQRFYLYNPFFRDGNRINLVQVWDHNSDGTITFNLLYSFEKENRIIRKEFFEEHYHPFTRELVVQKMLAMGYDGIVTRPVPSSFEETDFGKIDWYRMIGRKIK